MAGAGPKPWAGKVVQVSHMAARIAVTWPVIAASQGLDWQQAGLRSWNQELNHSIQMWDADILTTRLSRKSSLNKLDSRQKINLSVYTCTHTFRLTLLDSTFLYMYDLPWISLFLYFMRLLFLKIITAEILHTRRKIKKNIKGQDILRTSPISFYLPIQVLTHTK